MEEEKQDSVTFGTATKGGAVKCYMNMQKMTDDEVVKLVRRAKNLYHKIEVGDL